MKSWFTQMAITAAIATLPAMPAMATVTTFSSLDAFTAATGGGVSSNFEGIVPPSSSVLFISTTVDGVTFANSAQALGAFVIDANAGFGNYGVSFLSGQIPGQVNVTLPGASAFGLFYGSYIDAAAAVSALLSTGDLFQLQDTPVDTGVGLNFVGFVSDSVNLTSIDFTSTGIVLDITQFIVVPAQVVPLPAAVWLFGSTLAAGLASARRRTRR